MARDEAIAMVLIKNGAKLSRRKRRDLAAWLREQAKFLVESGPKLAPTFRARYMKAG